MVRGGQARWGVVTAWALAGLLALCAPARATDTANEPADGGIAAGPGTAAPAPGRALWQLPAGAGPHPVVVMLHGCGGATTAQGQLRARHRVWGDELVAQGYGVLVLDSFGPRGIRGLCTQRPADRPLTEADRVGDALAALAWLRQQPSVDASRIALLGWSHGGGVVLDALRQHPKGWNAGFRAAVAFYPGCTRRQQAVPRWQPYAPVLVLMGEADDWTPAAPCVALVQAARDQGADVEIVTYPGAFHDFDNPGSQPVRLRTDVPNGVHPGQGVHTGPQPQARAAAHERVRAWLAEHLR